MTENAQQHKDPQWWIKEPTETFHGIRVVDHEGTVFFEQVDSDGEEHQSIIVEEGELDDLIAALERVRDNHEQ